jgi:hypothetical protein
MKLKYFTQGNVRRRENGSELSERQVEYPDRMFMRIWPSRISLQ